MDLGSPADVSGNGLAVTYFDDGAENRRTLPNGAYTDHTWDDLRLPASVKNYDGTSSRTLKSQFDTFTYDGVFNMTGLTTSNNAVAAFNGTNTWAYDSKDRLTGDALTGGAAYSLTNAYDSAGNPTTYRNVASQTFNADNQKTASGTFVYDGNGNPTTYAGGTLTFDPMDKMVSIASSGTGSYRYRADGLRAWKGWNVTIPTVSGIPVTGATYFLYDGGNPVVEMDSSGAVTAINVFAHDGLVARVEGSTAKYYQFDAQGSVAHRTNSSGSVTSSSKYEAYGKHVNIPGSTVDTYGWNARWGYYYDSETGLYLCQQRYYDSNQGRWLNRDPIGYAGGVNVYGYCGSGPVGRVDPSGLNWIPPGYVPLDGKLVPLPWHPPSGVQIRWSPLDDCEATMAKLRIVEKMINTHMQWDWNVPAPRGGGRHKGEIAELWKVWGDLQNWASVVCHETPCFTSGNVEPVISSGAGDRSGTAGHGSSDQSNGVPDVDGLPGQIPRAPAPSPSYPTLPMPGRGGAPIYFPMPLPRAA